MRRPRSAVQGRFNLLYDVGFQLPHDVEEAENVEQDVRFRRRGVRVGVDQRRLTGQHVDQRALAELALAAGQFKELGRDIGLVRKKFRVQPVAL